MGDKVVLKIYHDERFIPFRDECFGVLYHGFLFVPVEDSKNKDLAGFKPEEILKIIKKKGDYSKEIHFSNFTGFSDLRGMKVALRWIKEFVKTEGGWRKKRL